MSFLLRIPPEVTAGLSQYLLGLLYDMKATTRSRRGHQAATNMQREEEDISKTFSYAFSTTRLGLSPSLVLHSLHLLLVVDLAHTDTLGGSCLTTREANETRLKPACVGIAGIWS